MTEKNKKSIIKDKNYLVIQGFMVNQLHLKGNDLLIYAVIYGFSQTENQKFTGSLRYLADWTQSTKQGVLKSIKKLLERKLIIKECKIINNIKFCKYSVNTIKQSLIDIKQSLPESIKQSLPNSKELNNKDYNKDKKNIKKENHGEFKNIKLSKEQYEKLIQIYKGNHDLLKAIEILDSYIENKNKDPYRNHYAVLGKTKWVYKKVYEQSNNKQKKDKIQSNDEVFKDFYYNNKNKGKIC